MGALESTRRLLQTASAPGSSGFFSRRCLSVDPSRELDLLVLALSQPTPEGSRRRAALRGAWARPLPQCAVGFAFVLGARDAAGRPPARRAADDRDLVVLPGLQESYANLSTKVLRAVRWAVEQRSFAFVLKTDDDSYVCMGGLLRWLSALQLAASPSLYAGRLVEQGGLGCMGKEHVELMSALADEPLRAARTERCRRRWRLAPGMQLMDGAGYVLSYSAAQTVVAQAELLRPPPGAEDLTVSLLLHRAAANLTTRTFRAVPFANRRSWRAKREPPGPAEAQARLVRERCGWRDFLVLHKLSAAQMGTCRDVKAAGPAECDSYSGAQSRGPRWRGGL